MKWYSIKKYDPPTCTTLLLRIVIDSKEYERYVVASCENLNKKEMPSEWEMANGALPSIDLALYRITHFAIPEPIEAEE